ncbi:MAG: hypothetical protein EOO68_21455 [Moraxellaceae bacterium]|nr:MAG: hypothetical protein EOO68_21455 [Moraxellaceae bacterium]
MPQAPLKSPMIQAQAQAVSSPEAVPHAELQNSGFLVDTRLASSRLQHGVYGGGGLLVIVLVGLSGLPLWLRLLLIVLFIGLTAYWLKVQPLSPLSAIWQGDSRTWYWQRMTHPFNQQQRVQSQRGTGELSYCRHLGWVIQLGFKSHSHRQPQKLSVLVWRDQVSQEQWRRLMVLSRLRQFSSTLLG